MIQALIFDLDDTLYPERDFVLSGYRAVAHHVADRYGFSFDEAFSTMMEALDTLGRQRVFPSLLMRLPDASVPLAELVEVYRQHRPAIRLFPGYPALLKDLSSQYRLGIITDGLPSVQERKVQALGLEDMVEKIIYSWEYGSEREKPHPLSFSLMLESLQTDPKSALVVGDNPEKDGRGAHGVGMPYAQVWHPASNACQTDEVGPNAAEFVMDSLFQLPHILRQLGQGGN